MSKIKLSRTTSVRANLPTPLDYGQIAFVNNNELLIGNQNGTDFIVNDYNHLINNPVPALDKLLSNVSSTGLLYGGMLSINGSDNDSN